MYLSLLNTLALRMNILHLKRFSAFEASILSLVLTNIIFQEKKKQLQMFT
jgi:hypothetical protein